MANQFKEGDTIVYDDGRPGHRGVKAKVLSVCSDCMRVQFEDRMASTLILFSEKEWMDHIKPLLESRRAAYRAVLEDHCIDPDDNRTSAGEDAKANLEASEMGRYCLVTCGEVCHYAYPIETFEYAKEKAFENVEDDIYPELPVCIVDLDTGEKWRADWKSVPWVKEGA